MYYKIKSLLLNLYKFKRTIWIRFNSTKLFKLKQLEHKLFVLKRNNFTNDFLDDDDASYRRSRYCGYRIIKRSNNLFLSHIYYSKYLNDKKNILHFKKTKLFFKYFNGSNISKQLYFSSLKEDYTFIYITFMDKFEREEEPYSKKSDLIYKHILVHNRNINFIFFFEIDLYIDAERDNRRIMELVLCVNKKDVNKLMIKYQKILKKLNEVDNVFIRHLSSLVGFFNKDLLFKQYFQIFNSVNTFVLSTQPKFLVYHYDIALLEYYLLGIFMEKNKSNKTFDRLSYEDFLKKYGILFYKKNYTLYFSELEIEKVLSIQEIDVLFLNDFSKHFVLFPKKEDIFSTYYKDDISLRNDIDFNFDIIDSYVRYEFIKRRVLNAK